MKAAWYERNGTAREVLQVGTLDTPDPDDGEVRVKLRFSGINPSDVKSRRGGSRAMAGPQVIPHSDGAGVIDAIGSGVDARRIGQRVWIWNAQFGRAFGTAAEYVVLPAAQAVPLGSNVPFEVGAVLGIPAMTAWRSLTIEGGCVGQTVLVAGGAGAVGFYAVQMARLLGARRVFATTGSPEKARVAERAGADAVFDYRDPGLVDAVLNATDQRGVDRIVELDMAANAAVDVQLITPGGNLIVYGSSKPSFELPFYPLIQKDIGVRGFLAYTYAEGVRRDGEAQLADWTGSGLLMHRPAIIFPLEQIVQAHELVEAGSAEGSVLLAL
ncbi:NADPH:quinone reductase [soil metagenome]